MNKAENIIQDLLGKEILNNENELTILYLDDDPEATSYFDMGIYKFNTSEDNPFYGKLKIRVKSSTQNTDITEWLAQDYYKVFVCDHNMPQQKGLDFITLLLKPEYPDISYCLYTGAGNINGSVREKCEKENILLFSKAIEFSVFLVNLLEAVSKALPNVKQKSTNTKGANMEKLYKFIAQDIIKDMQLTKKKYPDFMINIGKKTYQPSDIINEIENETDFGFEYLTMYIEGLKFFKAKQF